MLTIQKASFTVTLVEDIQEQEASFDKLVL